jgi:uncharacterized FlaG/YvyC family protein
MISKEQKDNILLVIGHLLSGRSVTYGHFQYFIDDVDHTLKSMLHDVVYISDMSFNEFIRTITEEITYQQIDDIKEENRIIRLFQSLKDIK